MYTIIRNLSKRDLMSRLAPSLVLSLVIAEIF